MRVVSSEWVIPDLVICVPFVFMTVFWSLVAAVYRALSALSLSPTLSLLTPSSICASGPVLSLERDALTHSLIDPRTLVILTKADTLPIDVSSHFLAPSSAVHPPSGLSPVLSSSPNSSMGQPNPAHDDFSFSTAKLLAALSRSTTRTTPPVNPAGVCLVSCKTKLGLMPFLTQLQQCIHRRLTGCPQIIPVI